MPRLAWHIGAIDGDLAEHQPLLAAGIHPADTTEGCETWHQRMSSNAAATMGYAGWLGSSQVAAIYA
ncbi:MAG: hypothetical protein ACRD2G_18095, partial [Terriglobia bacterium]